MKKSIIKNLILAQIASDAGKGIINNFKIEGADIALQEKYKIKEKFIISAIDIIKNNPQCGVKYYCEHTVKNNDNKGECHELITFFEIEEDNIPLQFSYHSKWWKTQLREEVDRTPPIIWNKIIGGTRQNCETLYKKYFL